MTIGLSRLSNLTYRIPAVLLLLNFAMPMAARPTPTSLNLAHENYVTQQTPSSYDVYDMSPASGVPGRVYLVNIISHNPNVKKITDKTKVFAPGQINVSDVTVISDNGLSAKIIIPQDTPLGRLQFLLKDKEGKDGTIIGVAEFDVTAIAEGPIPPGLNPEVDVMWGVMAREVVRYNFGTKIAQHYYGIQLSIGNNSGFDLQIAGVGFNLPTNTMIKNTVPTNSYRATRGMLERQEEIGTRAIILNSLKSAGVLFTGLLPFWHAVGPAANAARIGDILNGPVITGFERIYPDTILSHLTRLDDQTLRDGLIIKNNSEVRTTVFVAKQTLDINKKEGVYDTEQQRYFPGNGKGASDTTRKRYLEGKKKLNYRDDPQYVNLRLGELVLIGQPIKYLNRVQVITTAAGGPVTPPPTAVGTSPASVAQSADKQSLIIPGSFLDNAVITPRDPDTNASVTGIEFFDTAADSSGRILKTKISVKEDVPPKKYTLVITTPGGSVETILEVIQAPPSELSEITYVNGKPVANANQDVLAKIKITGKHLENSEIVVPPESQGKLDLISDAQPKSGELTQTIKVIKGTKAGQYKLQVKNKNSKSVDLKPFVVEEAKK